MHAWVSSFGKDSASSFDRDYFETVGRGILNALSGG